MKKTTKIIVILLVMVISIGLVGCKKNTEPYSEYEFELGSIDLGDETLEDDNRYENHNSSINNNASENDDSSTNNDTSNDISNDANDNTLENNSIENSEQNSSSESEYIENGIKPVKEEDVVINIAGVHIKLEQTWEEVQRIMTENNWKINEKNSNLPNEEKLNGYGYIITNAGTIYFKFMPNENETESVLCSVNIHPTWITSEDVDICGIKVSTTHDKLKAALEIYEELPTGMKYKLDDWVFISLWDTIESTGESSLEISRERFEMRIEE